MTQALLPLSTLSGHSAHCGVCWEPVYRIWAARESPDYTACPFGPYSAQTCPEATAAARSVAFFAALRRDGLTLASLGNRKDGAPPQNGEPQ